MRKTSITLNLIRYIVIIFMVFLVISPFLWIISTSLKSRLEINNPVPIVFFKPSLQNYYDAFQKSNFGKNFTDSITVSFGSLLLSLLLGVPAAYGIGRHQVGGKRFSFWILSTRMIPPVAVALPLYILYRDFKLLDSHLGLIFSYTLFNLSYIVWMMAGFIREIPKELDESAMLDGCNVWQTLYRIILPIIGPGLVATSIFSLIISWNEFLMALILTSINVRTLPVAIATFVTDREILWGQMSAAGVLSIVPVIIFTMIIQKQLIRGLTLGAIKE
ncbi:MAG: carbohydrate ABC transporter permease [Atribacterota bacterium]|jgi:multiple sugar transport system permease protein|uniref:carbohydrate ABC transporter permease n=1 Tax=Atribacter sp. TaxID=2847780 RepID=UPI00345EE6E6|nr:carbohydrate ABC transporter permease [Atribacterota bacterium]